eukprot:6168559-Amphidinium_carterae.1
MRTLVGYLSLRLLGAGVGTRAGSRTERSLKYVALSCHLLLVTVLILQALLNARQSLLKHDSTLSDNAVYLQSFFCSYVLENMFSCSLLTQFHCSLQNLVPSFPQQNAGEVNVRATAGFVPPRGFKRLREATL